MKRSERSKNGPNASALYDAAVEQMVSVRTIIWLA